MRNGNVNFSNIKQIFVENYNTKRNNNIYSVHDVSNLETFYTHRFSFFFDLENLKLVATK